MFRRSMFLALALAGVLAIAQDSSDEDTATESAQSADSKQATETASDEEFVPTKEVPADDEITFPVDI